MTAQARHVAVAIALILIAVSGLTVPTHGQSIAPVNDSTGVSPYQSYGGVRENISLSSGNLNLQVPLISLPGRNGHDLTLGLEYDSSFWNLIGNNQITGKSNPPVYQWQPWGTNQIPYIDGMWRLNVPALSAAVQYIAPVGSASEYCWTNFVLVLPDGSKHVPFNLNDLAACFTYSPSAGTNPYPAGNTTTPSKSADNSYVVLDTTSSSVAIARLKDGTIIQFQTPYSTVQTARFGILASKIEDTNGNWISIASGGTFPTVSSITDSLGRTVTGVFTQGALTGFTYKDSGGTVRTISFAYSSQTINSDLSLPNTPQTGGVGPGSIGVLSSVTLPNGRSYSFSYNPVDGELSKITYPTGGYTRYDFQTFTHWWDAPVELSTQCGDGCSAPVSVAASYREVIARHVCDDPSGSCSAGEEATTTYTPTIDSTKVTNQYSDVVDALGNKTHYVFSFRTSSDPRVIFPSFLFPRELSRYIYQGSSTLLRTIATTYSALDSNGRPSAGSLPIQETTTLADVTPNQVAKVTWSYSNTPYVGTVILDNVLEKSEYDFGASSPTRRTDYTWFTNSNLNILDRKASEIVYAGSGTTQIAKTTYEYDNYTVSISPSGAVQHDSAFGTSYTTRGNVTAVQRWRSTDGATLTTRHQYDDAGNIVQTMDPRNLTTTFSYLDSWSNSACAPTVSAAYVTKTTNPLLQVTKSTYNSCTGTRASATDVNNQITTFSYDSLSRLTQTTFPIDFSGQHPQTTITYNEQSVPLSVTTTKKINSTSNLVTTVIVDGLGRVTRTELASDPQGTDYVDTTYDPMGRRATVTNPYRSSGSSTDGFTSYAYDSLGRVKTVTHPDGSSVTTTYKGSATQVTDEGNGTSSVQRISQTDGLGRLTKVCEVSGATQLGSGGTPAACSLLISGTGFLTTYGYDVLNNLTSVSQGGYVARSFVFDSLSELTSSVNPESNTPTTPTTYTYDPDGNLATRTDARGITTTYSYEQLNRLSGKRYNDGSTPAVAFLYDVCPTGGCPSGISPTYAVGRMIAATTTGAQTYFSYDPLGRTANQWQCTPANCGTSYVPLAFGYDLASDMTTETNGFGVTFTYNYDAATRIQGMTSSLSDANHPANLLSNVQYNSFGAPTARTLGNGVTEALAYNSRAWLTSLEAGGLTITTTQGTPGTGSVAIGGTEQSVTPVGTAATGSVTVTGAESSGCDPNEPPPPPPQQCTMVYDHGTVTVKVNTFTATSTFNQLQHTTAASVLSDLASQLNGSSSPVTATVVGSVINLVTKAKNSSTNYPLTVTVTAYLQTPSYTAYGSGATLTGGSGGFPIYDTGTVTVTVNGDPVSVSYGSGSTASTVASALASGLNADGQVNATTSGGTITISSLFDGTDMNYSLSASSQTNDPGGYFSSPSFTTTPSGPNLTGGTNTNSTPAGPTFYTLSLGYALNGDVLTGNDSINGNWTYAYDDFNRLKSASATGQAYTYDYDRFGNRWHQNGPQSMMEAFTGNGSGNNNRMDGFSYDASGNLLNDGRCSYTYDAESRITGVSGGASCPGTAAYTYDAVGHRVQKNVGGATTDYIYDLEGHAFTEISGGVWTRGEVYAGGRYHVATYANGTTVFDHADWLGTERARSDMTGAPCDAISSLPYGDGQTTSSTCGDPSTRHFTGKERDTESNLDYFGARHYNFSLGRFMSADPGGIAPSRPSYPQSLNLFEYSLDNPIRYVDPNGKAPIDPSLINMLENFNDLVVKRLRDLVNFARAGRPMQHVSESGNRAISGFLHAERDLRLNYYEAELTANEINHEATLEIANEIKDEVEAWIADPTTSAADLRAALQQVLDQIAEFDVPEPWSLFIPTKPALLGYLAKVTDPRYELLRTLEDDLRKAIAKLEEEMRKKKGIKSAQEPPPPEQGPK